MQNTYKFWAAIGLLVLPLTLRAQISPVIPPDEDESLMNMSLEQLMQIEVVTASQQKESLSEVPVPVTVISDEMIRTSGLKNLRDVLVMFVPNMTLSQDHNEMNVAMRGVYASSQQKILILLNGHRLNSRVYSEANPDYSMSLEKIKQIEILRGPASSLYGNVALTAVVNIITKSGEDLKGGSVETGVGNYGQRKVSMLYGDSLGHKKDFLFWANYYQANGEKRAIKKEDDYSANPKDGYAILDGVNDLPSIDLGFNLKNKHLSLMTVLRNGKYTEPFSGGAGTGEVYDYDRYRKYMGVGPGLQSSSGHFDLKYEREVGNNFFVTFNGYADFNSINGIVVTNPRDTASSAIAWREFSQGVIAQVGKKYNLGNMRGDLLIGAQVDRMRLYDSFLMGGRGGEFKTIGDNSKVQLLQIGSEVIYSGFAQIKHYFTEKLILNIGFRFDEKDRHAGTNIRNFSPRVAFIYNPNNQFNVRISYSNSFVDGPYWYRYNSFPSYKGSNNLLPERLSSWQVTSSYAFSRQLQVSSNVFYNSLTDFIYRDTKATGDQPRYRNAGQLQSWGWENEIAYLRKLLKLRAVIGLQYAMEAKDYGVTDNQIHNVPNVTANLIADFNPLEQVVKNVWFNVSYRYVGKQLSPIQTFKNGQAFADPNFKVNAASIWNCGVLWDNIGNHFSLNARVYNLFDKRYSQGGSTNFAYPQAGRWFMITVGYRFK